MDKKFSPQQMQIFEKQALDCKDYQSLAGDHLDGDLPQPLSYRLDGHLHECEQCREFESSYRMVVDLARTLRHKQLPSGVRQRLRAGLERRLGISLSGVEA